MSEHKKIAIAKNTSIFMTASGAVTSALTLGEAFLVGQFGTDQALGLFLGGIAIGGGKAIQALAHNAEHANAKFSTSTTFVDIPSVTARNKWRKEARTNAVATALSVIAGSDCLAGTYYIWNHIPKSPESDIGMWIMTGLEVAFFSGLTIAGMVRTRNSLRRANSVSASVYPPRKNLTPTR